MLLCARAWRALQERRIVELSTARAEKLIRSDTWAGYREAADVLGIRAAEVDPAGAGSLRAFALALLALDYRDEQAAREAAEIIEGAERRRLDPVSHSRIALAGAALALSSQRAGTALERLSAATGPNQHLLTARVAVLAGNLAAATESVQRALAADARLPAALALRGDLMRRSGRATEARDSYAGAIAESRIALEAGTPLTGRRAPHARATFGLAKMALSRDVPAPEARVPLVAFVDAEEGVPAVERARAALYLSALQARLGERAASAETLRKSPVDPAERAWLERAAAQLEASRGAYRVLEATPPSLLSASDDDPYVPPPPPPPRPQPVASRPKLYGFKVHGPARPAAPGRAAAPPRKKKAPVAVTRGKRPTRELP